MKNIDVAFCFDKNRWKSVTVAIISMLYNRGKCHYNIHCVISPNFADNTAAHKQMAAVVKKMDAKSSIEFIVFDEKKATIPFTSGMAFGGGVAYYKQDLWQLLPGVSRVISLDDDVIVRRPLDELATVDLGDNYMMRFAWGQAFRSPFGTEKYGEVMQFNAGVIVLNLAQQRKDKIYKNFAENYKDKNLSFEQGLMAVTYRGRMLAYPDDKVMYNFRVHCDKVRGRELAIIHYTGKKPWQFPVRFSGEWWRYAKMSPFYAELRANFIHNFITYLMIMPVPRRKWRHALRNRFSRV